MCDSGASCHMLCCSGGVGCVAQQRLLVLQSRQQAYDWLVVMTIKHHLEPAHMCMYAMGITVVY
jgi:hypothetical protein